MELRHRANDSDVMFENMKEEHEYQAALSFKDTDNNKELSLLTKKFPVKQII